MLSILVGLLMGAQDSIAAGAGWVLAFLAQNPKVQDQIRSGIANTSSDADALHRCKMLKATAVETLRMRPPA